MAKFTKEKRNKIEKLVLESFNKLDRTHKNVDKFKEFFKKMNDTQFEKWANNFFKDEDSFFQLEALPYQEPTMKEIQETANFLQVPLEEYVTFKHAGDYTTQEKVPVGYIYLKRHQQILSKKNNLAFDIKQRNFKTGQVTGHSKAARESDLENYALQTIGATACLKELLGARADDMSAKDQLYTNIAQEGYANQSDIVSDPKNKVVLKTVDSLFLAAMIKTDLVNKTLLLPITADRKKER
jgi:hypothetical protein